jgi:hypothetical protein
MSDDPDDCEIYPWTIVMWIVIGAIVVRKLLDLLI